eukprot:TRINITY_DN17310_c0_g1_i1.p1 TRINITY_DN17310_c0_g1~~TRINITY_DN17310_c0_g1_i1.p1  ORF type:complete len:199 (+),score=60.60 TRINITY_DN17310_c0_g1_i1:67-663(+)
MGIKSSKPKSQDLRDLAQTTHFSQDEILKLYDQFKKISGSIEADNVIDKREFLQALGFKDSEVADRLFRVFDKNGDGSINFREFVAGLSIFCNRGTLEEKLKLTFRIYDVDNDGHIDKEELMSMLKASLLDNSIEIPEEHLRALVDETFAETDANGDGKISFEEYREMVMKHPHIISNITIQNSDVAAAVGDNPSGSN